MAEARDRVGVVRRIYGGWGSGDFRAGVERYDPHVVLVLRPDFPDSGVYVGPDGIAQYMRQLLASWSEFGIDGEEFIPAGDSVVVAVRQHGAGVTSGLVTELRYFQVWTFRGHTIVRIESIYDRKDALEAVGLRE